MPSGRSEPLGHDHQLRFDGNRSRDECIGDLIGDGDANGAAAFVWDTEMSGQGVSAAGTGKTTAEMQTVWMFLDLRWDFVDEKETARRTSSAFSNGRTIRACRGS